MGNILVYFSEYGGVEKASYDLRIDDFLYQLFSII